MKWFLIGFLVFVLGCEEQGSVQTDPTPTIEQEQDDLRDAAAVRADTAWVLASAESEIAPVPDEPDDPQPGGECQRCKGTGRIKPDGRIEIDCPDCGGDGVTSNFDREAAPLRWEIHNLHQYVKETARDEDVTVPQSEPEVSIPPQVPSPVRFSFKRTLIEGKEESLRTNKPAFVIYTKSDCPACEDDEKRFFSNPEIRNLLAERVLIKIDATKVPHAHLVRHGIDKMGVPAYLVANEDWTRYKRLNRLVDPDTFRDSIVHAFSEPVNPTASQKVPIEYAIYRKNTGGSFYRKVNTEDEIMASEPIAGLPAEGTNPPSNWTSRSESEPVRERIVYVASGGSTGGYGGAYSGGSAGGYGGVSIPVTYSSGSGGSAGGYGGIPVSSYAAPVSYYSPGPIQSTWNRMWTGSSGGWVCGPNGCFPVQ